MIDGWLDMAGDYERIAAVALSEACAGMDAQGVADYINGDQVVRTLYRDATAAEFWNAMDDASKLLLLDLVKADDAGARLLWANLQVQGIVAVDPDRISETVATLAEKATSQIVSSLTLKNRLGVGEVAASVADVEVPLGVLEPLKGERRTFLEDLQDLCAVNETLCLRSAGLAEGGFGFAHEVTAADVDAALEAN